MAQNPNHTAEYAVPHTAVWPILSDFTAKWIDSIESPAFVDATRGNGKGATRDVKMKDKSGQWTEECVHYDDEKMEWAYKLTSPLPGPFAPVKHETFLCTLSVKPAADGKCTISIGASYDADEPDKLPPIADMYGGWAAAIAKLAEKSAASALPKTKAEHAATYDLPAPKVWKILSDWSWKAWLTDAISPALISEFAGSGVGATRTVAMIEGDDKWTEAITAYNAKEMSYTYGITSPLPGAFGSIEPTSFACTLSVKPVSKQRCELSIGATYYSSAPDALPPIADMYKSWSEAIIEAARKQKSSSCVIA